MAHSKAAVFGAGGTLGRHIVRKLAAEGVQVIAACRRPDHELRVLGPSGRVLPAACDIRDARMVRAVVAGADMVINCVGVMHERRGASFTRMHADAPEQLASLARDAGAASFVHVSALGVGADLKSRYMQSKAEGEERVRRAFPGASLLRPSLILGEGGFLPAFEKMSRFAPVLPLILDGTTRFQPVSVDDVAEAAVRCAYQSGLGAAGVAAAGDRIYSLLELQETVLRLLGRKRLFVPLPLFVASALASISEMALSASPLTYDQVQMLKTDNVVTEGMTVLRDIGIAPLPAEAVMRRILIG